MQMNPGQVASALDLVGAIRDAVSLVTELDTSEVRSLIDTLTAERKIVDDTRASVNRDLATVQERLQKALDAESRNVAAAQALTAREDAVVAKQAEAETVESRLSAESVRLAQARREVDGERDELNRRFSELDARTKVVADREERAKQMQADLERRIAAIQAAAGA